MPSGLTRQVRPASLDSSSVLPEPTARHRVGLVHTSPSSTASCVAAPMLRRVQVTPASALRMVLPQQPTAMQTPVLGQATACRS
jgi:hypothetical protein